MLSPSFEAPCMRVMANLGSLNRTRAMAWEYGAVFFQERILIYTQRGLLRISFGGWEIEDMGHNFWEACSRIFSINSDRGIMYLFVLDEERT